ncbi:hypothetical protein EON68_00705 [archaeon]|nr:MAG: hypothetical protein EON68_00705 [archaeon]
MATSSYTAALFESLRRAAAEPSGAPAAVSTPNYGLVPAPTPAASLVLQTEPEGASAALQKVRSGRVR